MRSSTRRWPCENVPLRRGVLRTAARASFLFAISCSCAAPQPGEPRASTVTTATASTPAASSALRSNEHDAGCAELVESTVGVEQKTGLVVCPAANDRVVPDLVVRSLAASCADSSRVPPPSFGRGPEDDHCRASNECAEGTACVCRSLDRTALNSYQNFSRCLPSTCRGQADCSQGACAVSRDACLVPDGLHCHTPNDECQANAECAEGQICSYLPAERRFRCRSWGPCN
jgi:hypothetical protein